MSREAARAAEIELSIVMPCLNEARTVASCISAATEFCASRGIVAEVIVADNGSTDGSQDIVRSLGASVVPVAVRGYGAALRGGIAAARGRYVIMGDADGSYDFSALDRFVDRLRDGHDLVMGNRFAGKIHGGAMPWLHRYLGNPVLSAAGRTFFGSSCGDFNCGLRAFTKAAFDRMDVRSTGMEFAMEMVVKASLLGMRVCEVPADLRPDGRDRPPHLRTWRDGWRSLRMLLLYSPRWLFIYPGAALALAGLISGVLLIIAPVTIGTVTLDVHTMIYSAIAVLMGVQAVVFGGFARVYAARQGLLPQHRALDNALRGFPLELGLILGGLLLLAGLAGSVYAALLWGREGFGALDPREVLRIVVPSAVALGLGVQVIFSMFLFSLLLFDRH